MSRDPKDIILGVSKSQKDSLINLCGVSSFGDCIEGQDLQHILDEYQLKGIAVSIGPENVESKQDAINYAVELGKAMNIPVIPVSSYEASIFIRRIK